MKYKKYQEGGLLEPIPFRTVTELPFQGINQPKKLKKRTRSIFDDPGIEQIPFRPPSEVISNETIGNQKIKKRKEFREKGAFWKNLANTGKDLAQTTYENLPNLINIYEDAKSNINQIKNRKKLLEFASEPINTKIARQLNALYQMPDSPETLQGISGRNVTQDFEPAYQQLREREATDRDVISNLAANSNKAASQLLRNRRTSEGTKLAASQSQAARQEQARVDETNIRIANQNAALLSQHAKDKAKFENEKVQRLASAKLEDKERKARALEQEMNYDYQNRLNRIQNAAANRQRISFLLNQGVNTATGLQGLFKGSEAFAKLFKKNGNV